MILEYLFFEKTKRDVVKKYNSEMTAQSTKTERDIRLPTITYKDFDEVECWIVKYEIEGNNEQVARQLSDLNVMICEEFSPTILTNESSEYYNKTLYPLVNKFERSLRKLLYLKVARYKEDKLKKAIQDMEMKDFGEIYHILFVDEKFRSAAKDKIKQLNTRAEMLEAIDGLTEQTIWDILIGNSILTMIKDNFDLLKSYRNDVMHAHNIDYNQFKEAKKLFSDANLELESQIGTILQYPSNARISPATVDALYEKLVNFSVETEKITTNLSQAIDTFAQLLTFSIQPKEMKNFEKFLMLFSAAAGSEDEGTFSQDNSNDEEKMLSPNDDEVKNHE